MSKVTKVFWKPEEIMSVAAIYVAEYGIAKPSANLINEAIKKTLPAERRGKPFNSISMKRRGGLQILAYAIHELQGRPERNQAFYGEWSFRAESTFNKVVADLKKAMKDKPAIVNDTMAPAPAPVQLPPPPMTADDLVLELSYHPTLSAQQVQLILQHPSIATTDLLIELERRRNLFMDGMVNMITNRVMEVIRNSPIQQAPLFSREIAMAPAPRKKRITLITNLSSQVSRYENELDKLQIKVLTNDVGMAQINPNSDGIIVLAKFTNHSNYKNAKQVATDHQIPFYEIHGTGQLESLLRSLNANG